MSASVRVVAAVGIWRPSVLLDALSRRRLAVRTPRRRAVTAHPADCLCSVCLLADELEPEACVLHFPGALSLEDVDELRAEWSRITDHAARRALVEHFGGWYERLPRDLEP